MKLIAYGGVVLSLSLVATVSFAQNYAPQSNSAFQSYQANYRGAAPGSRYRSARTAFRMNLQDASGSDVAESLPSPSDDQSAAPDRQVIGTSPANAPTKAAPATSSIITSHPQGTVIGGNGSYVNYGALGTSGYETGGLKSWFGHGLGSGLGLDLGNKIGCGCCNSCGCGWYGGVTGLLMTRADDYGQILSYDSAFPSSSVLKTDRGYDEYFAGAEVRLGKYISNNWAIEGAYWGLYPDVQEVNIAQQYLGGDLQTALGFTNLLYDPGTGTGPLPVSQMFGDATQTAAAHRLRRSYQVHNAEINFVNTPVVACSKFSFAFLAGARYFKYNDGFTYSTDYTNEIFGDDPANELHYDIDVDNNLVGFQMGSRMNYRVGCCCGLSINGGANFGVYNNHITQLQRIRGGNGYAYDVANNDDYNIESSDDDLAFLGDISLGLAYEVCCNWRITGGYRLTAASGIANSTNQIPRDRDFYNCDAVRAIDSHDSLILHGGYFGVEHTW